MTVERWQAYATRRAAYAAGRARAAELRDAATARAAELAAADEAVARAREAADEAEAALPRDVGERREALAAFDARLREVEREARLQTEAQARAGEAWEGRRLAQARREAALEVALEERGALPDGVEPLEIGERAARSRWREVEQALEALGAVNHRASADHAAQAARLESLEADAAEATEAVGALDGTLEAIDTETNARLGVALEGLREGFADHVRQLFGATAVGAIEVEHEGSRPLGLRIRLQPPGKRTQSLNLLSVGERSMGALAFLFALMSGDGGGLPIAVLDEVDAPLDEANIRRFCTFVEAQAAARHAVRPDHPPEGDLRGRRHAVGRHDRGGGLPRLRDPPRRPARGTVLGRPGVLSQGTLGAAPRVRSRSRWRPRERGRP